MTTPFVHLHNHTQYSLLDGATRIDEMVKRVVELEMPAIAITDHGVMFGVMEFYLECVKKGIKPIVGMEAYVAPQGRNYREGREEKSAYHLLLLAKDQEGYRNLCKLHSLAALEGFYYRPRIDHDILRQHAKGLIGTTTCLGSEVCDALLGGNYEKAQYIAGMYKDIFDADSYFVELQNHGIDKQARIRDDLIRISKELKLPVIATNDSHYLCQEKYGAHDVLWCIGLGEQVENMNRLRFETNDFYIKSQQEMAELFKDLPEAIENTNMVADMCNLELGKSRAYMPDPELPPDKNSVTYLRELAEQGLRDRVDKVDERAIERLNYELEVIGKTEFEDYFLLVREFANYARGSGIAYGVRGSAAGSLVSYCIGITDVDPLEYDLTFERFLNVERIAMPDIDMDFEDARREEVIKFVTEKYGSDRVAQIVTFGTLGAKAAIKDSGRVLGYSPSETDKICKTIPNAPSMSLERAKAESPEFRQMIQSDPRYGQLLEVAESIEGTTRHAGVHAAGVVISKDPLSDYIPLYRGNDGQPITAYEMGILEKIGLLKMDFLGLSNLTVLARAVEYVRETHQGKSVIEHPLLECSIQDIPLDEPDVYEMLSRGETVGVFQLESAGMKRNIMSLKPNSVRELAAMVALYRPGPMEHIPQFINTKFGVQKLEFSVPQMEPILKETYGVIVYQDQVLKIVQALAGFTLGKADILRRAMGKKDKESMDSMKIEFIDGCSENNIAIDKAEGVWNLLLPFAGYAFNKAHAVCYALLAYQTAYLKSKYPTEFFAAILEAYRDKEDRITTCIEECKKQKIAVLPPSVNDSNIGFHIEAKAPKGSIGAIRFGLAAIKGVGKSLAESIIREREHSGPYRHLYEFSERVREHGLNKTALEALIKSGALDDLDRNREKHLHVLDGSLVFADNLIRERESKQSNLFMDDSGVQTITYPELPHRDLPDRAKTLAYEKEVMGVYLSDHPLRGLEGSIREVSTHTCLQALELDDGQRATVAGVVTHLKPLTTKKGDKMLNLVIEDFSGQISGFVPPATCLKIGNRIEKDSVFALTGAVTHRQRFNSSELSIEFRVDDVTELKPSDHLAPIDENLEGTIYIKIRSANKDQLENLRKQIVAHPGGYRVLIEVVNNGMTKVFDLVHRSSSEDKLMSRLRKCYIDGVIDVEANQFFATTVETQGD